MHTHHSEMRDAYDKSDRNHAVHAEQAEFHRQAFNKLAKKKGSKRRL